jgi:UDP-N-acetylglucosamine 4,6-dehydratase/5-epimerase
MLDGARVLITGGTGTFGRAMTKRLLAERVRKVIVFSRDEYKQDAMRKEFGDDQRIGFFLGDVRDRDRLYRAFSGVDFIFHAAALKQVPAGEYNPTEFIKTNVFGASNVVEAAIDCGVQRVVALSTDKACRPINLYGMTKGCLEKLVQAAGALCANRTLFAAVRYGNVAGSRGSVVPFFRELIANRQRLQITDERMTRFWMRLDEAVDLVLLALRQMHGGETFVSKIPSVRMPDLAFAMGREDWDVVGIRPGEKLAESLIGAEESTTVTDHGSHYTINGSTGNVDSGFEYNSENNPHFLSVEEIREELKLV